MHECSTTAVVSVVARDHGTCTSSHRRRASVRSLPVPVDYIGRTSGFSCDDTQTETHMYWLGPIEKCFFFCFCFFVFVGRVVILTRSIVVAAVVVVLLLLRFGPLVCYHDLLSCRRLVFLCGFTCCIFARVRRAVGCVC